MRGTFATIELLEKPCQKALPTDLGAFAFCASISPFVKSREDCNFSASSSNCDKFFMREVFCLMRRSFSDLTLLPHPTQNMCCAAARFPQCRQCGRSSKAQKGQN